MTRASDARKMIEYARERGLLLVKAKHGGYLVTTPAGEPVTTIPATGKAGPFWVKRARRDINAAVREAA